MRVSLCIVDETNLQQKNNVPIIQYNLTIIIIISNINSLSIFCLLRLDGVDDTIIN